jgi:hypothetical protein
LGQEIVGFSDTWPLETLFGHVSTLGSVLPFAWTVCLRILKCMKHQLTPEQVDAIEGIIARRMANTGETREQACLHISKALRARAAQLEAARAQAN